MRDGPPPELLRCAEVVQRFGIDKTQIYRLMRAGDFPPPVRIGRRSVRWRREDLDRWVASRPTATPGEAPVDPA